MSEDLVHRAGEILNGYNMVPHAAHLGVAVSGGADSVVLLHILHRLLHKEGCKLTVLHVNHQLRGAESDADEQFVLYLAQSLDLNFHSLTAPVPDGNLEQEARRLRQTFFLESRKNLGLDRIALGHTRSDQAETVLFRFLRGSGTAGLAGMTPVTRSGHIRPLLFFSRAEVREYAKAAQLEWREDSSNKDRRFRRNHLRLVTLPRLSADYNGSLEAILSRTADVAASEEEFWRARNTKLYRRLAEKTELGIVLPVERLHRSHVARQRRLIRHCILQVKGNLHSIDVAHVDGVLGICGSRHGHDRLMIPGVDAIRSFDTLLLARPESMKRDRSYEFALPFETQLELPFSAGTVTVSQEDLKSPYCVTVKNTTEFAESACLDLAEVVRSSTDGSLKIRNWEPGDKLQRKATSHPEKIKTLFQENKVVLWDRRHWPVIVVGNHVAWTRGFGADIRFHPNSATKNLLRIRWERASSRSVSGE